VAFTNPLSYATTVAADTFTLVNAANPLVAVGATLATFDDWNTTYGGSDLAFQSQDAAYVPARVRWSTNTPGNPQSVNFDGPFSLTSTATAPPTLLLRSNVTGNTQNGALTVLGTATNQATLTATSGAATSSAAILATDSTRDASVTATVTGGASSLALVGQSATINTRTVLWPITTAAASSTANQALAAGVAAIPGASITLTLSANDVVMVTGTFDFGNAGVISTAWGYLYVNGAATAGGAGPGHSIGAGGRSTVSYTWRYVAASAGSFTFDLRANQTGGTWTAYTPFGAGVFGLG
jgi:hypothetical protein